MNSIRKVIDQEKIELGLVTKENCTKEENATYKTMIQKGESLPKGVYAHDFPAEGFYKINEIEHTDEELALLLQLQQTKHLKTVSRNTAVIAVVIVTFAVLTFLAALTGW